MCIKLTGIYLAIRQVYFPLNPKNLDLFCNKDLDLGASLERKKIVFNKITQADLRISVHFGS